MIHIIYGYIYISKIYDLKKIIIWISQKRESWQGQTIDSDVTGYKKKLDLCSQIKTIHFKVRDHVNQSDQRRFQFLQTHLVLIPPIEPASRLSGTVTPAFDTFRNSIICVPPPSSFSLYSCQSTPNSNDIQGLEICMQNRAQIARSSSLMSSRCF